ncbi:MAG: hypothetical protein V3T20_05640, partial [Gemmatimonadota bacterium]
RIDLGEEIVLFLADLVPTTAHLPLPWIMGYDVEPLITLQSKKDVLGRAAAEGWMLAFEHDPFVAWGRATTPDGGTPGCVLKEVVVQALVSGATLPEGKGHAPAPGGPNLEGTE